MKGLKQRLKRPTANTPVPKDAEWSRQDQRVWQAVAGNQPTKVAAKLSKHPDVDVNRICPNVGYSVVHYAAAKGLDDCLNILLAHRADASACDITGATPLHAAARYGHKGTTSKLLASRTIKVNLSDKNQCTALHFAAFEGHIECLKLIANVHDVDLNPTDKDGRTPLMVAAAMGQTDICKELVERGCDIHHKDNVLGHTALTLAADSGHAEVVRLLYDNGANHVEQLHNGKTAMDLAKQKDRRSVVDALHIVQLTEAANKSSNGPRLSTSSNKYKLEDAAVKKRHSVDCVLDQPQTYIDDLVAGTHLSTGSRTPKPTRKTKEEKKQKSNLSRVKAAVGAKMKPGSRRGSDASGLSATSTPRQKMKRDAGKTISPDSNTLSLYTDGGNHIFYEKEMKFYDSNSSLDVSSTCSAMNNMSKSTDSLKPTPEETDRVFNGMTSPVQKVERKVEGTDFSRRPTDPDISKLQKKNAEYEQKISDLEDQLKRANEVSIATEKLQKNAEEVSNAQLSAAKEEYERKETKMERDIEDLKQISVKFERRNKELVRRLNAAQQVSITVESLKEKLKENEETSNALRNENSELALKMEKLDEENEKMKQLLEKEKENESTIISQAKQKIMEAEHRCNQAEERGAEAERRCGLLEATIREAENKQIGAENKLDEAKQKITEIEQGKSEAEEKCIQVEREFTEAERLRTEMESKLADVTKEKRKVEREMKKLRESSGKDKEKLKGYEVEFSEISDILLGAGVNEPAKHDGDDETVGVSDLKAEVQKLVEKLKVEEGQLNDTESKKKDLEDKLNTSLEESNRKVEELEKQIKESQSALVKKAAECSRLDSELKHTKTTLKKLETDKKKLEEDLGNELTKNRAELAQFEVAKLAQADEFTKSRDELADLRQQLDEALNALEKLREESIPRDAYEADCAKIRKDSDILKKEITKTLEKFAFVQLELANREQEISDLRVERNQSEARSSKYEAEVSQLKSKCHESEVQVNILRQQLTDTKHKLDKSVEEINSLRKARREMTVRLATKQGEINETERKTIENLRKQIDNLSTHVQESEKRYRDTVAIYRGHLLAAVTGHLDTDVEQALQEIIKLRGNEEEKAHT